MNSDSVMKIQDEVRHYLGTERARRLHTTATYEYPPNSISTYKMNIQAELRLRLEYSQQ